MVEDQKEEEAAKEEEEVVVEKEAQPSQEKADDELDAYSKGVQTRIKKLTEKYRQEERDKNEAVTLSQRLIEENKKLKSKVQSLDSGYLAEYGNRLTSQTETAKRMYKEAYEAGDSDKMVQAQEMLSAIAVDRQRYGTAKARAEQQRKAVPQQVQPTSQDRCS